MNSNDFNFFEDNGYLNKENILGDNYHSELFYLFYDLSVSTIKRNKINLNYDLKKVEDLDFNKDLKELDKVLLDILKINNKLIGELYDTVSYSSCFLKLISDSNIEDYTRSLLNLSKRNTLNENQDYDLSLKKSVTYFLEHAYKNKNFTKESLKKSLASNNFII